MSEWLIEPVSKTGVPFSGTGGSNPPLSAVFFALVMIIDKKLRCNDEFLWIWRRIRKAC